MDREGIRRLAAEQLGLATSPYRFASSLEEYRAATSGEDVRAELMNAVAKER